MNKEKLTQFVADFFNDVEEHEDINDYDSMIRFYTRLNDEQTEQSHNFFVERLESLSGMDGSTIATTYHNSLKCLVSVGDVDTSFEKQEELVNHLMDVDRDERALQAKTVTA